MILLHKIHFHVHYEQIYEHKKFQKFSIKTLIIIAWSKCIKYYKTRLRALGVKVLACIESSWSKQESK